MASDIPVVKASVRRSGARVTFEFDGRQFASQMELAAARLEWQAAQVRKAPMRAARQRRENASASATRTNSPRRAAGSRRAKQRARRAR